MGETNGNRIESAGGDKDPLVMKAYIVQNKDGEFASVNFAVAYDGFRKMGWEIVPFSRPDNTRLPITPEDVVVGFIEDVNAALFQVGIESPAEINYPD